MELFYTWIFIALEIINTFLAIYLIYFLYKRKNQFPYSNVSPLWIITFMTGKIKINIKISVLILFYSDENSPWLTYLKIFSTLFVHYVWIWPVIGRLVYITQSVYFNYSFIQDNLNIANYKKNVEAKQNKKFTEDKNLFISKLVIVPFIILFFVFIVLTFTGNSINNNFECYFYSFNSLIYEVQEMCINDETINKNIMLGLIILKYFIDFLLQFIILSLVYIVNFRFKIKNDIFFMKTEVILLTVFWWLIDNSYHGVLLFHDFEESIFSFSYNILQDFAFILLYYYLTFKRSKIDSKDFSIVLHNFEMFMQNPIYFNYFREYIQKLYEDEEGCLILWRRCHHYKSNFKYNNLIDNVNEAYTIFVDCIFDQKMSIVLDKYTSNQSNFLLSDTNSRSNLVVELPIDMYEMIEKVVNQSCEIDEQTYCELYDEAFKIINAKLYNRYLSMFRNQQEYEKLNKLICYMEFDMIDDGISNLESDNTTKLGNFR